MLSKLIQDYLAVSSLRTYTHFVCCTSRINVSTAHGYSMCSVNVHWMDQWMTESCCFLSAPSSKALLCVCIAWPTSEQFLMVRMRIRKVQIIVGCSMMEEFLIPDLVQYVSILNNQSILSPYSLPNPIIINYAIHHSNMHCGFKITVYLQWCVSMSDLHWNLRFFVWVRILNTTGNNGLYRKEHSSENIAFILNMSIESSKWFSI